jgi:hypothetical protein
LDENLTLMELYEETHIENRDKEKTEKKFVHKKNKSVHCKCFDSYNWFKMLRLFININNIKCN